MYTLNKNRTKVIGYYYRLFNFFAKIDVNFRKSTKASRNKENSCVFKVIYQYECPYLRNEIWYSKTIQKLWRENLGLLLTRTPTRSRYHALKITTFPNLYKLLYSIKLNELLSASEIYKTRRRIPAKLWHFTSPVCNMQHVIAIYN